MRHIQRIGLSILLLCLASPEANATQRSELPSKQGTQPHPVRPEVLPEGASKGETGLPSANQGPLESEISTRLAACSESDSACLSGIETEVNCGRGHLPEIPVRNEKDAAALDEAIREATILTSKNCKNDNVDLKLLLADFWTRKAQYMRSSQEDPSFNEKASEWKRCRLEKQAKSCGPEPRPAHAESDRCRKHAMDWYESVLHDYPKHKRSDEARCRLGMLHLELSRSARSKPERRKHYAEALRLLHRRHAE